MSVQQQSSLQMNNDNNPNQMNDAMMQNMMKFFGQQMNQFQMMGGQGMTPQQGQPQNLPVGPMSDLEKFYANKVNDMNSFYSQLNHQPSNQQIAKQQPMYDEMKPQQQGYRNSYEEMKPNQPQQYIQQQYEEMKPSYKQSQIFDDDRPIKPTRQQYNEEPIKPARQQYNEEPIKPARQQYNEEPIKPARQQYNEEPIKPSRQQYNEEPIKPARQSYNEELNKPARPAYNEEPIRPMRQQYNEEPRGFQGEESFAKPIRSQNNAEDDRPIKPSKNIVERPSYDDEIRNQDERPIKKEVKRNDDERRQAKKSEDEERRFKHQPQHSFDEQPIKPQSKANYDNMLGEQPVQSRKPQSRHSDSDGQVKTFLKKGTRKFLSNAQTRSTNVEKEQSESGVMEHMQELKKVTKKPVVDSPPIKSRFTESNLYQQVPSGNKKKQKENEREKSQAPTERQPKKATSFLSKGEGKGGGKGNINNPKSEDGKTSKVKYSDDDAEEDMYKNEFQEPEYKFDDEQDWKTNEQDTYSKKKEVAKKQPAKQTYDYSDEEQTSPKPITKQKIVQKYFGGDKEKKQIIEDSVPQLTQVQEEEIVRKYVQGKIDSLNGEIAKFKGENDRVRKTRIKYEDQLKQLSREREEWEKQKEIEKLQLEDWKEEEKKKINREKKVQDRAIKTFQNVPTRKEREELEILKRQVDKQSEDMKGKDQKSKLNYDRMRKQCEDLQSRNLELQAEVKALESVRVNDSQSQIKKSQIQQAPQQPVQQATQVQQKPQQQQQQLKPQPQQKQQSLYSDEEDQDQEEEDRSQDSEDEYDQIVNVPDNGKKVQFVQSSFSNQNQSMVSQKSPKRQDNQKPDGQKQTSKRQYDIITIGDIGRMSIKHINRLISENEFCFDQNKFYQNYSQTKEQSSKIISQNVGADGKVNKTILQIPQIQRIFANGKKEVIFHNDVRREVEFKFNINQVFQDGYTIVHFTNSDIKQTLPNGTIIYFFADANTTQTTLPSGPNIYRFQNQQIEIHFQDGSKEIKFSDGTEKFIHINGEEETMFSDGIFQRIDTNKVKYIEYPNGNIDVIYPDGQKVRQHKSKEI